MKPEILGKESAYSDYLTVDRVHVRLTDGTVVSRDVARHGDAVAVLPYDARRRCALIMRLFRAPVFVTSVDPMSKEACAGMIENEDAVAAVQREAFEELGVTLGCLEFVGRIWSSPGVSSERQSLFLAPYCAADRVGMGGGGLEREQEDIAVTECSLLKLAADGDQGRIADGKLLTLSLSLRLCDCDGLICSSDAGGVYQELGSA